MTFRRIGASLAGLALLITACSKKSDDNPSTTTALGTVSFSVGRQVTTIPVEFDTAPGSGYIHGVGGFFPGTKDSASISFVFLNYDNTPWSKITGLFSDTALNQEVTLGLTDMVSGMQYQDQISTIIVQQQPVFMNFLSNDGSIVQGTFSGNIYDRNNDTMYISKGTFNLKMQY